MMPTPNRFTIQFNAHAWRQFVALAADVRVRILNAMEILAVEPRSGSASIKKLIGGENEWRLRVGDYRVIYEIVDNVLARAAGTTR